MGRVAASRAANGGSDIPDAGVVSCVVGGFRGLQFPQTEEGGAVTAESLAFDVTDGEARDSDDLRAIRT